ncbi:vWA domain-containing protein [Polycladomyces zharkentensis]|nr:VWA domain-containing protein [Polycladomyces sp. WAk]
MVKRKVLSVFIVCCLSLFTAACGSSVSGQTDSHQANTQNTMEKKKPIRPEDFKAATTVEGMLREGPGKYAGNKYDKAKVQAELDKFPKGLSAREVYNRLIYYLAEDYKPILKKVEEFNPAVPTDAKMPASDINKDVKVQNLNVEILLDSSGSMAEKTDGAQRMELAKQAIRDFVSSLPKGARVSLRVYGHKGTNSPKDKALSCKSSELAYPLSEYDAGRFNQALDSFKPGGWTPLAASIQAAQRDLEKEAGKDTQNIVYVVSDGVETCGGDPVKAAQSLYQSDIQAVVNIIGFDVDDAGQQALQKVAEAGGGTYRTVRTKEDLKAELERRYEELRQEWEIYEGKVSWDMLFNGIDKHNEAESIVGIPSGDVKHSLFWDTENKERDYLNDAVSYLYQKGIIDSDTYVEVGNLILDRYQKLDDYRLKEEIRLSNEIEAYKKRMEDRAKRGRQQVEEKMNQN